MELLERAQETTELKRALEAALRHSGQLVFVSGEAGIGKSVLVGDFCDHHAGAVRIWPGTCDALFTPRPLGPLLDVASAAGGTLADLAGQGVRPYQVAEALRKELSRSRRSWSSKTCTGQTRRPWTW